MRIYIGLLSENVDKRVGVEKSSRSEQMQSKFLSKSAQRPLLDCLSTEESPRHNKIDEAAANGEGSDPSEILK
jgi:hypothetical protein